MFGLKRKAGLREHFTAGFFDTGNVSATVNGKLVLSWAGTPTQKTLPFICTATLVPKRPPLIG
jgi:hypothetical protein